MKNLLLLLSGMVLFISTSVFSKNTEKEWTFIIFLNGNNNLTNYTDLNLNQLEEIGSTEKINIVVQWAKFEFENTYRLYIEKDEDPEKVTSPAVQTLPRVDMGDYKEFVEFVDWSIKEYPAKRYFVDIWNHGSGWNRDRLEALTKGISYDDHTENGISSVQLGLAMKEIATGLGRKVDILGLDACLMAMVEVVSEVYESIDYFVASEDTEPAVGWPYHSFYRWWSENPEASTEDVTKYLVKDYVAYLSDRRDITLSSIKAELVPQLWQPFATLTSKIASLPMAHLSKVRPTLIDSHFFAFQDHIDVGDWLKKLRTKFVPSLEIHKQIQKLSKGLQSVVVANDTSSDSADAQGLAFWVPLDKESFEKRREAYSKLRFAKETGWDQMLEKLMEFPVCEMHPKGQFASQVIDFSSQFSDDSWSANQVLEACNTARYGEKKTAWSASSADMGTVTLTLEFPKAVYSEGVIIRESNGHGFIKRIELFDEQDERHKVWEGEDSSKEGVVNDFFAKWDKTSFLSKKIKVTVDTDKNPSTYEEIDSFQLIGEN